MLLTPAQIKPKSFESRRNLFLPGVDASHVYVRASALGCFHGLNYQYPNLSVGADRVGGQLRGDKECPFSCAEIKSAPPCWQSLEEDAGKRWSVTGLRYPTE